MLVQEGIVGDVDRGHFFEQFFIIKSAFLYLVHHFFTAKEGKKILVSQVFVNTITYINIFPAIIIKIKTQGSPAPSGGIYPTQLGDFAIGTVMIIQLQAVAG